ncbi:armadillo-like helical domain-containing protein 4 [Myxocyprinus asiaticus]|uniref:armadillo-like helical domain-containing protein 4 n=1 Tax=Myxocyprinus asiaticus TaxID=70543 RepID=UPI002221C695|nr:armadillo-like helical domain-containing protein 4 [Myxocyprinus asiaticus]XP_051500301.1 armadillo-like helical domain-containing protein 4 [Myxocyprinus asiaticus]
MSNGGTLQSLLFAAVSLSSWAAPLESIVALDGMCCEGQQQRTIENQREDKGTAWPLTGTRLQKDNRKWEPVTSSSSSSHLPSLVSDSSNGSFSLSPTAANISLTITSVDTFRQSNTDMHTDVISSKLLQSSSPDDPGSIEEEAGVNSSVREGLGRVTAVGNEDRQSRVGEQAVWSNARYQKHSVGEQQSSTIPASIQSVVDHLLGTTDGVSLLQASTTSSMVGLERDEPLRFISENVDVSNGSSGFTKGKTGNIQPGGLDDKGTVTPLTRTPLQKDDRRLEADTITGTPSDSTDGPFRFSPLISNRTTLQTSLTITSGDSLGGLDLQDNTPVSGLRQLDLTFNSRLVDPSDTWTETVHLLGEEVSALSTSQEVGTDATMSSEDLPLIFEPFEDVAAPVSEPSVAMVPTAVSMVDAELEQMVSMETAHTPSDVTLSEAHDWSSSWQMSGVQKSDAVSDDITQTSVTQQPLTDAVQLPALKPKTDTEDVESREEPDEDEVDEETNSDEEEEESEEDLTETTISPPTRAPYSLIPPPPVWVQRNQGLVRSWVELIREKAGYVSGMLAPVGIGIAGALLLVGALYSIRVIHRKRRDNFKHQRRKPPREVRSGPDNTMLLGDSSEDEF